MTKKPKPKYQRLTKAELEQRFDEGKPSGHNPSELFGSENGFREYMKSYKKDFHVDKKLNAVMSLIIQNLLSTIVSSLRPLIVAGEIERKHALIFFSLFADRQREESLGNLLDWSLNLTNLCREADIIPKGVEVIDNDENDEHVVCGIGVTDECSEEDMAKLLAQFDGEERQAQA